MRLSFWDRVLADLYVVLSLCLCVLEALRSLGIDAVGRFYANLTAATGYWYFIYFGFLIIILLLGVFVLRLVFARRSRRSDFVTVDAGEKGKIIVAMDALQEMVRQASTRAEGVSDMNIHVEGHEDSISVLMELTAEGGAHLPTVTMNLQRDIREYVETNCGVAVRKISVNIVSMQNAQEPGALKRKAQRKAFPQMKKERQTEVPEKKAESFEPSPSAKEYQPAAAPEDFEEDRAVPNAIEMSAPQADDLPELQMPKLELTPTPADSPEDSQSSAVQGEAVSDFAKRFSHADDAFESSEEPQEVE